MTGDDHARLGEDAERWVVWDGHRAFMRLEPVVGHDDLLRCAALVVDGANGAFTCAIYERRPSVCRELAQGGPACLGELATKSDRPKRALVLLRVSG